MIEPIFKNAPRADVGIEAPSGAPGMYHVIYVLAVPGRDVVQDEVNFPKLQASGDSLLAVDPEVHELRVQLQEPSTRETQVATVGVNSAHRLRDIELEIRATSFDAAEQIAHDIVSPLLSRWAFLHDVAITTSGMQIIEAATMIQRLQVAIVGAVKGFSDTTGSSDPEHRLLLSAYRDGISATEPLWQALSLYRLAEGVLELRKRRSAEAVASGLVPNEPSERVPDDLTTIGHPAEPSALLESLAPYKGKKFTLVLGNIREALRHAIAHLDPSGNPLIQDRWDDVRTIEKALPGLRWMSRQLLEAELQEH